MKKYLSLLGLLAIFAQPAFAQCASCNLGHNSYGYGYGGYLPAQQVVSVPVASTSPYTSFGEYITGAACPVCHTCNTCPSCSVGAACPAGPAIGAADCCSCPSMSGAACPIKQEFKKQLKTGAACPVQKKKMKRPKYRCKCQRIR